MHHDSKYLAYFLLLSYFQIADVAAWLGHVVDVLTKLKSGHQPRKEKLKGDHRKEKGPEDGK